MLNEYLKFDEQTPDGTFTMPSKDDLDILALKEFCKKNGIKLNSLTEDKIEQFRKGGKFHIKI